MPFKSHEEYFASQSPEARVRLEWIQHEVEARVPDAARTVSYNMPAFKLGRTFFYFAAFRKHIGIYPPISQDAALVQETARFRGPRGNLSFPLNEDFPLALIGRVACALAAQYSSK